MRFAAGFIVLMATFVVADSAVAAPPGADGLLTLEIVDSETGQPLPARVKVTNSRGRPAAPRGVGVAAHADHFYVDSSDNKGVVLPLRTGTFNFSVDAGVEYKPQTGHFEIERHADDSKQVAMNRFANLAKEGWYAGDVDVDRDATHLDVALRAEGLTYVPLIAYRWADGEWTRASDTKLPDRSSVVVERSIVEVTTPGGRLLCVAAGSLEEPPDWPAGDSLSFILAAKADGYRVLAASPVEWEFPAWVVTGKLDGVVLFANSDAKANRQRPADRVLFGGAKGAAMWQEAVYFRVLDAGVKLPLLSGSHTGPSKMPLGAARTYVCCDGGFSRDAWWQHALAGASVVSTGPLLRPRVGGDPPGQVFATSVDEPVEFSIALNLATRTPIEYLEILRNGEIADEVRLADWAAAKGKLPPLQFDRSGWFAVRAVTTASDRYDVALTAPYYVQSAEGRRISSSACQFFIDWLDELAQQDASHRTISDEHLATARKLWQQQLARANAD